MNDWEKEFDDKFIAEEWQSKHDGTWKINSNHAKYIWSIKKFISKLLTKERQKIAKALRMGEIKAGHGGSATEYDSWYADGFNKAVEEINQIINSYLKKQEKK